MKKRAILLISALVILFAGVLVFFGLRYVQNRQTAFEDSGYVLVPDAAQDGQKQIQFSAGAVYRQSVSSRVNFRDAQGTQASVAAASFLHYGQDTMASMTKGLLSSLDGIAAGGTPTFYALPAGMQLTHSGSTYSISTSGTPLTFSSFLWKLNADKYMLVSDTIQLHFSDTDERDVSGYLEISYVDNDVICLQTEENLWQTVSAACYATLADGTVVDFSDGCVKIGDTTALSFNQMIIDADDNVVIPTPTPASVKVPTFNVNTENGKNADSGVNAEQGESGTTGEVAQIGAGGANGSNGTTGGTAGTGGTGAETRIYPSFAVKDWTVSASAVSCTITVTDEDGMLNEQNATIQIFNNATGEKVYEAGSSEDAQTTGHDFSDLADFSFAPDVALKPDTQYRLVVTAAYTPDEKTGTVRREFLSRTFYTDSIGVYLEEDSVTQDTISLKLTRRSYSAANEASVYLFDNMAAAQAFQPSGSETNWIGTATISFDTSNEQDQEKTVEFSASSATLLVPELTSNRTYYARVVTKCGGTVTVSNEVLDVKTLKQMPEIGSVIAVKNRSSYSFDLQAVGVTDPDHGIVNYRYNIYLADEYADNASTAQIVTYLDSTSPSGISAYVDGTVLEKGCAYVAVLTETFYDNEKNVLLTSAPSAEFIMEGTSMPAVTFLFTDGSMTSDITPTSLYHDQINGALVINGGSPVLVSDESPLTVTVEAPGYYYQQFSYGTTQNSYIQESGGGKITIPYTLKGLREQTQYRFSVFGYVDFNDDEKPARVHIGDYVVSTGKIASTRAVWSSVSDASSAVSAKVCLQDVGTSGSAAYDMSTTSRMLLSLYEGSSSGKKLVASTLVKDESDNDCYKSTIADTYYNADGTTTNTVTINENTFGMTSSQLTANVYTIEISNLYDYTYDGTTNSEAQFNTSGYQNTIPVMDNSYTVTRRNAPPALPTVPGKDVSVVTISNASVSAYGGTKNAALPDDAVVGYLLTPNYDNSARLGRTIRFYAFEAGTFNNFNADNYSFSGDIYEKTQKEDPVTAGLALFTTPDLNFNVSGTAPQVALLLGDPTGSMTSSGVTTNGIYYYYTGAYNNANKKGMSRGMQYVFAYTAGLNLSAATGVDFFYPQNMDGYIDKNNLPTSPLMDLPKQDPIVYAYPWAADNNFVMWKYWVSDPDGALVADLTDTNGAARAKWLLSDAKNQYTIQTGNTTQLPDGSGTAGDFAVANYTYQDGASSGIATMQFAAAGTALADVKATDFQSVVMPVSANFVGDGVTQVSAEVAWYNTDVYQEDNSSIQLAYSTKKKISTDEFGNLSYSMPETVPLFRLSHNAADFDTAALTQSLRTAQVSLDTGVMKQFNILRVNIDSLPDAAAAKVAGVKLIFTDQSGTTNPVTLYKTLEGASSVSGAVHALITLRTSELADLVGKNVKTTVQFLYTSGNAGYSLVNAKQYALRQTGSDGTYGNYLAPNDTFTALNAVTTTGTNPMAVFNSAFTGNGLISMNAKAAYTAQALVKYNGGSISFGESDKSQDNLYYTAAQKVSMSFVTPIELATCSNSSTISNFVLTDIVPTITLDPGKDIAISLNEISLNNIKLGGATESNVGQNIYFTIAKQNEDGTSTFLPYPGDPTGEDSKYWPMSITKTFITFSNLELGTSYHIIPWCKMGGEYVQLLDGSRTNGAQASYDASTSQNVTISNMKVNYVTPTYYYKTATVTFSLDQLLGFDLHYVLFAADSEGKPVGNPLLQEDEKTASPYKTDGNQYVFKLGPADTAQLSPGQSYGVSITATAKTGGAELGTNTVYFTAPAYVSPYFYTNILPTTTKTGSDQSYGLTCNITLSDPGSTLTAPESSSHKGEYWVRAFEMNGGVKGTRVYDAPSALNSGSPGSITIEGLKPSSTYLIELYGVSDLLGTGKDAAETPLPNINGALLNEYTEDPPNWLIIQSVSATTLDENGVRYGDMSVLAVGNKIRLNFNGAVGVTDVVKKYTYSVAYWDGVSNNMVNKTEMVDASFVTVDASNGVYYLELPFTMTIQTRHSVTVRLLSADGDTLNTISGVCYYG